MKNEVQRRCELLAENRQLISKVALLENTLVMATAAASFAEKDKTVDIDSFKENLKLLKKKQNMLSELRGHNELILASKMSLIENPEEYIDAVISVYDRFQKGKFLGSSFRALAAITICDAGRADDADSIIEKTNELLKGMRNAHPFLTTDEDTCLAVLLAMTDRSTEEILTELETSYQNVKSNFAFHENAAYSLSQVLTSFDGDPEEKAEKALSIFNAFKESGEKYGKEHTLASLGVLINIDMNAKDLVSEIIEVADYLKEEKGFGFWHMDKATRLMFGTLIVSGVYSNDNAAASTSVVGGTLATIIAQEICMYMILLSAAVANVSSN